MIAWTRHLVGWYLLCGQSKARLECQLDGYTSIPSSDPCCGDPDIQGKDGGAVQEQGGRSDLASRSEKAIARRVKLETKSASEGSSELRRVSLGVMAIFVGLSIEPLTLFRQSTKRRFETGLSSASICSSCRCLMHGPWSRYREQLLLTSADQTDATEGSIELWHYCWKQS